MFEAMYEWALESPERLITLAGSVLMGCGALLVAASIGNVYLVSLSMVHKGPDSLADVVTGVPTWFVPESSVGIAVLFGVAVIAFAAHSFGHKVKRMRDLY
jgi:hypothetical protein